MIEEEVVKGGELEVNVNISKSSQDNNIFLDMGIFDEGLQNEFSLITLNLYVEDFYYNTSIIEIPDDISYGSYVVKARAYFSDNRSGVVSVSNIEIINKNSNLLIFMLFFLFITAIFSSVVYYLVHRKRD